jgi:hypothetical protein
MKRARPAAVGAGILMAAAQLVRPERTNPPLDLWPSLVEQTAMPPAVAAALQRSCADCHSHRTRWPWYSAVAPVRWLVVDHVDHGRRHLNFSVWPPAEPERAREAPRAICDEVREGRMPLRSYLLLHADARLAAREVEEICAWAVSRAPGGG